MSDTTTETVERIARGIETMLTKRLGLGPDVKSTEADTLRALAAQRDAIMAENNMLREALEWADRLSETLQVVNAQHGGRNAARLLKDFRDFRATLARMEKTND